MVLRTASIGCVALMGDDESALGPAGMPKHIIMTTKPLLSSIPLQLRSPRSYLLATVGLPGRLHEMGSSVLQ